MKALVKFQKGDGFMELREIPEPEAGYGQVKIKVRYAGICGSDLHIYHQDIGIPIRPPVVTGHEFSGTITQTGEGVEGWKTGDRVVCETAFRCCGTCLHCREGSYNLCDERRTLGYWHDGAFAPYTVVPAARLHALPESVSFLAGALLEPLACVTHAVMELTGIRAGDLVLVSGPGAIGLAALQVARSHGARVIVSGTTADADRLEAAKKLGAEWAVDVMETDLLDLVGKVSKGAGVDAVLECSGNPKAVDTGFLAVRKRGQFTQIGLFGGPIHVDFEKICYKEIRVTGSLASRWASWEKAIALVERKHVVLEPLVSDIMPLAAWKEAFGMFEAKKGLKLVLDPWK